MSANLQKNAENGKSVQSTQEKIILQILTDDIIFTKIEDVMFKFHNVFDPDNAEDPDGEFARKYNGYATAFEMLGIDLYGKLGEILGELTYNMKNESEERADILAQKIYAKWLDEIKNFFLIKKVA